MLKILLVDADVETPSDPILRMLAENGHRIQVARSGKTAMDHFREAAFDVVLLDMFLPDCMGYELIPAFREKDPDVRIIGTTTFNTRELERKNRLMGITYYMSKPYSPYEIKCLMDHFSKTSGRSHHEKEIEPDRPSKNEDRGQKSRLGDRL